MQASLGGGGEKVPEFQLTPDCPGAGVLCAVPALLANGLLKQEELLPHPPGYYSVKILLMLLSFLALSRRPSLEKLRYLLPGEWGRMLGLDRIPEVRTLRAKLEALSQPAAVAAWSQALSQGWMQLDESLCGLLYLDGHVRAYTGSQTALPRRFSSRNRLCLPSLMDYWVNDCEGKPFFVVTAMGTEGMIHYLKNEIVPRLLRDVPNQPSAEALAADPTQHRFIMVFDRECWSVELFAWLWRTHRIAIITYQRGTYQPWPKQDFQPHLVQLPFGHTKQMNLAERPFQHSAAQATETQPEVSLREIRRLCDDSKHQTSIIATVRTEVMATLAGHVFSRKSQENYFKYGSYEFHIDQLPGYALAKPPPGQTVMSPAYVELTNQNNRLRATIRKLRAERDQLTLSSQEPHEVSAYQTKHADLTQCIEQHERDKKDILAKRRQQPKRIRIDSLPEDQQPSLIAPVRLQFINAIRMTAYRAEMAMVALIRQYLARSDDAHNLIKDLFTHHADLIPDHQAKTLTIRVHNFTCPMANQAIEKLFVDLNSTETVFPNTDLVMRFELVSPANPRDQEV